MRKLFVLVSGLVVVACGGGVDTEAGAGEADTMAASAAASATPAGGAPATPAVRDASGQDLGTLTLTDGAGGITISGTLSGLAPGVHALHLHTTGACEPPFQSAGGHWNPTNAQHGTENPQGPHFGDLANITVGEDGTVTVQATSPGGTLSGTDALLDADGAAVVVHAGADDNQTDPAGGAGDRIACGVVTGA